MCTFAVISIHVWTLNDVTSRQEQGLFYKEVPVSGYSEKLQSLKHSVTLQYSVFDFLNI